ncbi:hypothetical protein [Corynebacterium glaucum]|uniref:hypothetical protein n=1 Tax=Corynebacterium glaucum TaxID=187491 RepID=UPI0026588537|nr:hypothetical protein [Corynebacterium glaucum]
MDAKRVVSIAVLAGILSGCSTHTEPEPVVVAETKPSVDVGIDTQKLDREIARIERQTSTRLGLSLYDGTSELNFGSVRSLPAWSTVKVPIAFAAEEHCEYDDDYIADLIESSIEISDNDATDALWYCLEAAGGAQELVHDEIGGRVDIAWGRTPWPFAAQARYAYGLSQRPDAKTSQVIRHMRNIADEQAWGLGELNIPIKGGWGDIDEDGSWQSRQMGFGEIDGQLYGISVGAVSEDGSFQDTIDAIDALTEMLAQL